ncbi:MAG: hypothetical protein Q8P20_01530 [bacterium]|nr:hypothetical protein [bacterium]
MKTVKKRIHMSKFVVFYVIIGMLFVGYCSLAEFRTSHDMQMIHNYTNETMECCSHGIPFAGSFSDFAILASSRDSVDNLILFVLGVSSLFLLLSLFSKDSSYLSFLYFKKIRDKYGSWRYFEYFLNLFRLGIINPKVY